MTVDRCKMAGFTLIEMLVAVALLALIGALGWRGLDNVQQASLRLSETTARWQELALVGERIGSDVRQAIAVPGRQTDGRVAPPWQGSSTEKSAQMSFTRLGDSGDQLSRLAYRWQDGQLDLLLWPTPDALAPGRSYRLLSGIEHLEFAYLDRQGRWLASWPNPPEQALPRALRLRLQLQEGGTIERIFDVPAAD